jgi:hypothetical protein
MCQEVRCRFLWRWHKFYSIHKMVDNISGILGNVCLSCSIMDLFCIPFSPLLVNKRCLNEIWKQDIDQLSFKKKIRYCHRNTKRKLPWEAWTDFVQQNKTKSRQRKMIWRMLFFFYKWWWCLIVTYANISLYKCISH